MNSKVRDIKSEKFTFIIIICILLFSLIYMSMYITLMKAEVSKFKEEIEDINSEMNLLIEVIPVKDLAIEMQREKIVRQLQELREALAKNEISDQDNKRLTRKLKELKQQFAILKNQAKQVITTEPITQQQEARINYVWVEQKDTLLAAKEKEIATLKNMIENLKAKKPDISVSNKLSAYYFVVLSSDKKNRSGRTNFLTIQLQLKGNLDTFGNKDLKIEVRDPSNSIISSTKDRIKSSNHYIISYKFEPYNYTFKKGKYSIRIYSEDNEFQSVTFLTLV